MDLMQFLPLVGGLGPTALLSLVVLMILTGRLVPKSVVDDHKQRADHWQSLYTENVGTMQTLINTNDKIIKDYAGVANHTFSSIPTPAPAPVSGDDNNGTV